VDLRAVKERPIEWNAGVLCAMHWVGRVWCFGVDGNLLVVVCVCVCVCIDMCVHIRHVSDSAIVVVEVA
jgi:hypothetical protein